MNDEPYSILNNPFGKDSQFTPLSKTSSMPVQEYIDKIKAELSEHCLKLMERMDSCYEIEKAELTAHADDEIARLEAVSKDIEETIQETFVEDLVDAKKEIARLCAVGKDVEETITDRDNNEDFAMKMAKDLSINPKCRSLFGMTFSLRDIKDMIEFCIMRMER